MKNKYLLMGNNIIVSEEDTYKEHNQVCAEYWDDSSWKLKTICSNEEDIVELELVDRIEKEWYSDCTIAIYYYIFRDVEGNFIVGFENEGYHPIEKIEEFETEAEAKKHIMEFDLIFKTKSGLGRKYENTNHLHNKKPQHIAYFDSNATAKDYLEMLKSCCGGDVYIYEEAVEIALKNKSIFEYIEENFYFDNLLYEQDATNWCVEADWFQHKIEELFKVEDNAELYHNLEEFIEKEFSAEELDEVFVE